MMLFFHSLSLCLLLCGASLHEASHLHFTRLLPASQGQYAHPLRNIKQSRFLTDGAPFPMPHYTCEDRAVFL